MLPAASLLAGPMTELAGRYVRHRPETTLLYRLVAEHWPALRAELDAADRPLPAFQRRLAAPRPGGQAWI